jgi:predicted metal-dependent hydrolase
MAHDDLPCDLLGRLRHGIALFDRGYHWEAHEAWELAWHSEGRRGARADALKALIKLAAACVKIRQRQPRGVRVHASRAAELLRRLEHVPQPLPMPLDLGRLGTLAEGLATEAGGRAGHPETSPLVLPPWRLADLVKSPASE